MPLQRLLNALTSQRSMKYFFLASHGLRSPLSAIRWGCGRLRKTGLGTLSKEQQYLVNQIHVNAKKLSDALSSMLLLARIEDSSHRVRPQKLNMQEILLNLTKASEVVQGVAWHVSCPPDTYVQADRLVLETLLRDLLSGCIDMATEPKAINVRVHRKEERCRVEIESTWDPPFLRSVDATKGMMLSRQFVGGTPGLMLALASALVQTIGGTVELVEEGEGEAETSTSGRYQRYRIVLELPRLSDEAWSVLVPEGEYEDETA